MLGELELGVLGGWGGASVVVEEVEHGGALGARGFGGGEHGLEEGVGYVRCGRHDYV